MNYTEMYQRAQSAPSPLREPAAFPFKEEEKAPNKASFFPTHF